MDAAGIRAEEPWPTSTALTPAQSTVWRVASATSAEAAAATHDSSPVTGGIHTHSIRQGFLA
jgi:hypothetical protein